MSSSGGVSNIISMTQCVLPHQLSSESDHKPDNQKLDSKKIKKYLNFLLYSYCHYTLELFNRLCDNENINYNSLIEQMNNYILNVYLLCISNNIHLDKIKSYID